MNKKLLMLWTFLLCFTMGISAGEVTIDFSAKGYANGEAVSSVEQDGITVLFDKGSNSNAPKYYNTGTAMRVYGGGTMTVSSANTITSIVMTFGTGDGTNEITADAGTYADGKWTGSATAIKFTVGGTSGHKRIKSLTVTYGAAPTVAKPSISGETPFVGSTTVSIDCTTEGAAIYYTIDGTDPSTTSTAYTAPFELTKTATVKAVSAKDGEVSGIVSKEFVAVTSYSDIASVNALANKTEFGFTGDIVVVASPTNYYTYVKDATGSSLIYSANKQFEVGSHIAPNWTGKVSIYNNLFEIVPTSTLTTVEGKTETITYPEANAADLVAANMNKVVTLKGVTYTTPSGKNFDITLGEATIAGYNQFGLEIAEPAEGKTYDIVGAISVYKENVQFQPISIAEAVVEEKPTEPVVTLVHTASSYCETDANAYVSTVDAEKEHINNSKFSGTWQGAAYADFSIVLPEGHSIKSASLAWSGIGSSKDRTTDIMYVNAGEQLDYEAFAAGNAKVNLPATKIATVTFKKSATTDFTTDVTDAVKTILEAGQGNIIFKFTNNVGAGDLVGKGAAEKAPVLTLETVSADQMTKYTVVAMLDADTLKVTSYDVLIGATATANAEDMAAFKNEDGSKKYIYVGGNTEITTVKDSASNVITLVFREAEKFNYSVQAVNAEGELMQTLTSGSDFEGETIYAPYGRYIHSYSDSTLYEASATNKEYRKTLTLNEDGAVLKVTYNKSAINNVVFFYEGEDVWGMTATTAGNAPVRSSNAAAGYPAEDDVELTGLSTGKYKLIVGFANSKSSSEVTYDFALAEDTLFSMTSTGINMTVVSSDEFTVLGNYVPLKVLKGGNDLQAIDFFYIQKTGGVPAVAVANIAEAKKQKNGTPIKLTLNDAKVTVQTYAMTGTFVALEDASGAIQLSSNMALEGITEQNALNGELYVSFVNQNDAMQLDLSDSTQYSQFTATPSTFTPAEIKYSEVKDIANLYRFVKLGACKTIYDEEMYMYYAISGKDTIPVIDRFMNMQTWMGYATEVPEQVEYMTGVVMHNGEEFCFYPYAYGEDKAIVGVPTPEDIVVNVTEGDIAAAVEAEKAKVANVGKITINLTEGAAYTVNSSIVAPAALVINGNGATVDASALDANMITTDAAEPAEWVTIDSVAVKDVTVKGLGKALFYSAIKNRNIQNFVVDNSVVEVAKDVVVFDFTKGSVAMNFVVKNSTLYAPTATTKSIYSSQSAQKGSDAGATADAPQTFTFENTTLYNLGYNKNLFTHRSASQTWMKYVVKNNVVVNTGKANFMTTINQGQDNKNPQYEVTTNSVGTLVDGVYTDLSASQLVQSNVMGTLVTSDPMFKDAANGDFTLGEASEQNTNKLGDPRWFAAAPAPSVAYLCGSTTAPDEAIYNALVAAQYDVTPLNYDEVTLTEEIVMNDFAGKYDVVVLAGGTGSGTNLAKSANILLGKVNVLSTKSFWYKHYGTNGGNPGSADAPSLSVAVSEGYAEHPLFTGIDGAEFAVFNDMGKSTGRYLQSNGSFADEAYAQTTIATTLGADCIGEAWAGDYGYVIIPVDGAQPEGYLTEDGKKLFVNAVQYLIDGVKFTTGIDGINSNVNVLNGDVYSINGIKVRKAGESLKGLAKGLYIVNGKKFIVK